MEIGLLKIIPKIVIFTTQYHSYLRHTIITTSLLSGAWKAGKQQKAFLLITNKSKFRASGVRQKLENVANAWNIRRTPTLCIKSVWVLFVNLFWSRCKFHRLCVIYTKSSSWSILFTGNRNGQVLLKYGLLLTPDGDAGPTLFSNGLGNQLWRPEQIRIQTKLNK